MARDCRMREKTVGRAVKSLEEMGAISVHRTFGTNSRYILNEPDSWVSTVVPITTPVVKRHAPTVAPNATPPWQSGGRKVFPKGIPKKDSPKKGSFDYGRGPSPPFGGGSGLRETPSENQPGVSFAMIGVDLLSEGVALTELAAEIVGKVPELPPQLEPEEAGRMIDGYSLKALQFREMAANASDPVSKRHRLSAASDCEQKAGFIEKFGRMPSSTEAKEWQ
jgi:hypothetical protein